MPEIRRRCLRTLHRICGRRVLLPQSLGIAPRYYPTEDAMYYGGFADVWNGRHQGREVVVKVLKVYKMGDLEETRRVGCRRHS